MYGTILLRMKFTRLAIDYYLQSQAYLQTFTIAKSKRFIIRYKSVYRIFYFLVCRLKRLRLPFSHKTEYLLTYIPEKVVIRSGKPLILKYFRLVMCFIHN